MNTRHKLYLVNLFIIMTSVFALKCPTSKECFCKLRNDNQTPHIDYTISNDSVLGRNMNANSMISVNCINSSDLSKFKPNVSHPLATHERIIFKNCNLSNNMILIKIAQKLSAKNIKILILENMNLGNHHINGFKNLKELYIINSNLTLIEPSIFDELINLTYLELWNNNLTKIELNIFDKLIALETLLVSSNNLVSLPKDIFAKLENLRCLNLEENNFTHLPKDFLQNNKELIILTLNSNNLEVLPDNIFLSTNRLQMLDLSNNRITSISKQLFNGLYLLEKLNMTKNYLKNISEGSFTSLDKLKILYLSNNHLEDLPDNIFRKTNQLEILDLSNNRITAISEELFFGLKRLEQLNMERNHLKTIPYFSFSYLISAKIIKLSNNNLTLQQFISWSPFDYCSLLEELYLANNSISKIFYDWIESYNLHILDLSYNNISSIQTEDLLFSSYNIIVNLTHNKIQHITLHDDIKEESKNYRNVKILMEHNPFNCDCDILYDLLRYNESKMGNLKSHFQIELRNSICPKELEKIRISDLYSTNLTCRVRNTDFITVCPEKCDCFLKPHDKAFIFDCSNKNLTSVPSNIKEPDISSIQAFTRLINPISQFELNFSHNELIHMPNLRTMKLGSIKKLILSHNKISEISSNGLSTTMKILELHNNDLSRIHPKELRILEKINLTRLTLHENPWECDCDATELLYFIKITKFQILAEVSKIMCHREKKSILEMTFNDFCPSYTTVIFSISTAIALIGLITGIFGLYYKYQTHIKIWLFAHQWCLWFVTEEELDKDKLYDAFVSFSHMDNDFVVNKLVPTLESGPTPFKLCLHYRDWVAGEFIPDNIARSVENSRRTIVVLSPNFLESVWGRMEFRTAHCQALNEGRARVIMILYDDIKPTDDLDPELKAYISMNTYIQWGDPWFWDKLRYALPHQSRRPTRSSARREVLENHELTPR